MSEMSNYSRSRRKKWNVATTGPIDKYTNQLTKEISKQLLAKFAACNVVCTEGLAATKCTPILERYEGVGVNVGTTQRWIWFRGFYLPNYEVPKGWNLGHWSLTYHSMVSFTFTRGAQFRHVNWEWVRTYWNQSMDLVKETTKAGFEDATSFIDVPQHKSMTVEQLWKNKNQNMNDEWECSWFWAEQTCCVKLKWHKQDVYR